MIIENLATSEVWNEIGPIDSHLQESPLQPWNFVYNNKTNEINNLKIALSISGTIFIIVVISNNS